jgi:hypothetical protein
MMGIRTPTHAPPRPRLLSNLYPTASVSVDPRLIGGVVHAWVGQKLLNCFIFKCFTRKTLKKVSIGHR